MFYICFPKPRLGSWWLECLYFGKVIWNHKSSIVSTIWYYKHMLCKSQQDHMQSNFHTGWPKNVPKKQKPDFASLNSFLLKRSFMKLFMFSLLINPSSKSGFSVLTPLATKLQNNFGGLNPVKHLRWRVLQKQLTTESCKLFLQSTPS